MNDVVKYHNELNKISLSGFSALDLDVLMLLCSRLKEKQCDIIKLTFFELKEALSLSDRSDDNLINILNRMNRKLKFVGGHYENDDEIVDFILFPTFRIRKNEMVLIVQVNSNFAYLLNSLNSNFTKFELKEFINLESKYSKSLYRLLKQYRTTGLYKISADRLRELMDCPKSYANKIFIRDCLNVAIKEVSQYFPGLEVEIVKARKRGAPIKEYTFTFQAEDAPAVGEKPRKAADPKKNKKIHNFSEHERDFDYDDIERIMSST